MRGVQVDVGDHRAISLGERKEKFYSIRVPICPGESECLEHGTAFALAMSIEIASTLAQRRGPTGIEETFTALLSLVRTTNSALSARSGDSSYGETPRRRELN
jgi:hypothetical protein